MAFALGVLVGNSEIEANGFSVPDMKVPVGLWWKSSSDVSLVLIAGQICRYDGPDKIETFFVVGVGCGFGTHQFHLVKSYYGRRLAPPRHLSNRRYGEFLS